MADLVHLKGLVDVQRDVSGVDCVLETDFVSRVTIGVPCFRQYRGQNLLALFQVQIIGHANRCRRSVLVAATIVELLMGLPWRVRAKSLSPDLTVSDVTPVRVADTRVDILQDLFGPGEVANLGSVITIDSADRVSDAPCTDLQLCDPRQ